MICTKCKHELDDYSEETIEFINKHLSIPIEPICNDCNWKAINEMDTVQ